MASVLAARPLVQRYVEDVPGVPIVYSVCVCVCVQGPLVIGTLGGVGGGG